MILLHKPVLWENKEIKIKTGKKNHASRVDHETFF